MIGKRQGCESLRGTDRRPTAAQEQLACKAARKRAVTSVQSRIGPCRPMATSKGARAGERYASGYGGHEGAHSLRSSSTSRTFCAPVVGLEMLNFCTNEKAELSDEQLDKKRGPRLKRPRHALTMQVHTHKPARRHGRLAQGTRNAIYHRNHGDINRQRTTQITPNSAKGILAPKTAAHSPILSASAGGAGSSRSQYSSLQHNRQRRRASIGRPRHETRFTSTRHWARH
jgi:hypothetical protein